MGKGVWSSWAEPRLLGPNSLTFPTGAPTTNLCSR